MNVFLHLINVLMIFVIAQRLGFSMLGAWIAALLWGVHPVHTEAVTYQSATADPLYTFFILFGVYFLAPEFQLRSIC